MYLINVLAKPTKESDQFDKVVGAYVSIYIDFKDIDGAYELAKFYVVEEGWEIEEVEEEYFSIDSENDVDNEDIELYEEALEYGFSMIFNCYESED
ncbi:hypothetical protein R3X25_01685 [Lutibacter sp. TH_r2]|uniref:hypothetical protein n=1 Tax=Lutibacter sp. TH_r2 TaxID=3082083 RepID=UPI002954EC9B|nr:hypothetical protein [Lutibacter sp. TH_r2]MDV7185977.1 hypothetical protein [Lutibacter sp. TH_r2]